MCSLVIVDPTLEEEDLATGTVTIVTDEDGKLCSVHKPASVHLPRIGYATKGFNWYGTERLIRKYLARRGIPTFVYYFPRNKASTSSQVFALSAPNP
uniref:Chromodomain-helicase-DNA-binding protein 1-like n=1 Tax=Sphaerodactylus townsendi TaxID=933632 RepID=A0ACB8EUG1_9SAUR